MKPPDPLPPSDPQTWMDRVRSDLATRHPGIGARMTDEEYAKAVRLAETVVAWVEERLR